MEMMMIPSIISVNSGAPPQMAEEVASEHKQHDP